MHDLFASVAIAGAWGYMGRKLLDAARRRDLPVRVLDPGPWPVDLGPDGDGLSVAVGETHLDGGVRQRQRVVRDPGSATVIRRQ
jgi:hypothetical protein